MVSLFFFSFNQVRLTHTAIVMWAGAEGLVDRRRFSWVSSPFDHHHQQQQRGWWDFKVTTHEPHTHEPQILKPHADTRPPPQDPRDPKLAIIRCNWIAAAFMASQTGAGVCHTTVKPCTLFAANLIDRPAGRLGEGPRWGWFDVLLPSCIQPRAGVQRAVARAKDGGGNRCIRGAGLCFDR